MEIYRPSSCLKYLEKNGNTLSGKTLVSTWEITSQGITAKFDLSRTNHIKSISFHGRKTGLMLRWAVMDVIYCDFNEEEKSAA